MRWCSDAVCFAQGLVWLFGNLPEVPVHGATRQGGGHLSPQARYVPQKIRRRPLSVKSRAAVVVQPWEGPGVRKSPALTLSVLRCRGEGASAKLVCLCVRAKARRVGISTCLARVPPWDPTRHAALARQRVQSEPKMTIGHEHTTVATSTQHQPRKPQASNLLIR